MIQQYIFHFFWSRLYELYLKLHTRLGRRPRRCVGLSVSLLVPTMKQFFGVSRNPVKQFLQHVIGQRFVTIRVVTAAVLNLGP
jgi:hypothetical protein